MPFDNLIGRQIDDFVIQDRIGQGAMAIVYKAFQPSINRYVALKVIRLDGSSQHEEFRQRFAREAEVIASLEHIHILPIYAYGISDDMAYLAMRWLRGGSLSELLRHERLPLDRTADVFKQIASGLSYAHSKGVIHRDLKPSNIMLDDAGNAYLTDFGLAKLAESSAEITKSGTIVGTPAYMSPEQLRGEPLDYRSDIYSLGVLLYNMVAGRLPFDTSTSDLVSIIYQHLEKPPTPPSEFNPDVPPGVEEVILKALQKNRDDRFNSADEMARALNVALGRPGSTDSLPALTRTSQRTKPMLHPHHNRRRNLLALGGVVLTMVVLLGAVALLIQDNITRSQLQATASAEAILGTAQQVSVLATQTAAAFTPPPATVIPNKRAPASEAIPSEQEIALARAHLGNNGFIGYIACTLDSEFHAGLAREIRDFASAYGLDFRVYDAQSDPYKEITAIERARSDGVTALIVCPLDATLLADALSSVQKAGMPLVVFGEDMPSYGGVLVGGDNYLLGLEPGRLAGKLITEEKGGQAQVIILDFPDLAYLVARANGLEDGLKENARRAKVVGRYKGATRENGKASVSKLIADGIHFDAILSINDAGAFGAIDAMKEAGIDPNSVIITSVDAEALARQYISQGYFMRGSVQSSRIETARTLVNAMVKLLAGSTISEHLLVPPGPMITKAVLDSEATEQASGS
jgi:serine/threonine protein kinase/DNA-binding LacI/PurR family transcriptional regulator